MVDKYMLENTEGTTRKKTANIEITRQRKNTNTISADHHYGQSNTNTVNKFPPTNKQFIIRKVIY